MIVRRRNEIYGIIVKNGSVKVSELVGKYGVGEATIRRDLKYLSENYGVVVTYGGAFMDDKRILRTIPEISIDGKKLENQEQKQIIAKKAASLINDGDTIALNSGSTLEYILDYIPRDFQLLNIVTLGLNIAVKAASLPFANVFIPGGKLRNNTFAICGESTFELLKKINASKGFFGLSAVSINEGITHPSLEEVASNQALMSICQKKYLACDSSKYDVVTFAKLTELTSMHAIITDGDLPEKYVQYAQLKGIELI